METVCPPICHPAPLFEAARPRLKKYDAAETGELFRLLHLNLHRLRPLVYPLLPRSGEAGMEHFIASLAAEWEQQTALSHRRPARHGIVQYVASD